MTKSFPNWALVNCKYFAELGRATGRCSLRESYHRGKSRRIFRRWRPRRRRGQRLALGVLLVRQINVKGIGIREIIETRSLPTLTRSYFTLITRSPRRPCASYLAALPSTRAIPDRDVFYVADPTRSIEYHGLNLRSRNVAHF